MRLTAYAILAMGIVLIILAPGCGKKQAIIPAEEPLSRTFDEELGVVCYESKHGLSCISLSLR